MNRMKLMSLALTALALGGCSSEDNVADEQNGQHGASVTSYLAVNIANVGDAPAARAVAGYENGTDKENAINKVRFYFFNANGTPYMLAGTSVNYLDQTVNSSGSDADKPVEKITDAVVVINGGTKVAPYSMVAVVNPAALGGSGLSNTAISLDDLKGANAKFSAFNDDTNGFVMTNSVYGEGTPTCEVLVSGHVKESAEAATDDPVDIYVERVVAKVSAGVPASGNVWSKGTDNKYRTKVGKTADDKDVYAIVEGWGLFNANPSATLFKQLSSSFTSDALGINPWTTADYHRSFWEQSVALGNVDNPTYEGLNSALGGAARYVLPNTPTQVASDPMAAGLTYLGVAATLVYSPDGQSEEPAEICRYRGVEYLGQGNVLTAIANNFAEKYFVAIEKGYRSIAPGDLEFVVSSSNQYEVVAKVKSGLTGLSKPDGEGDYVEATAEEVNAALAAEPAEVRDAGKAYYFTPVRHLGTDAAKLGYYGIVRNHSYQVTITGMSGFGTPVYNGKVKLNPIVPPHSEAYLAARINVLSWRVVSSSVDLDATK